MRVYRTILELIGHSPLIQLVSQGNRVKENAV